MFGRYRNKTAVTDIVGYSIVEKNITTPCIPTSLHKVRPILSDIFTSPEEFKIIAWKIPKGFKYKETPFSYIPGSMLVKQPFQ